MRLDDPSVLKSFLGRHGLSPDKALGQHFLVSAKVVDKIVAALPDACSVLEIGPGPGVLTAALCEAQLPQVIALELDLRMQPLLAESAPCCKLRLGDALHEPLQPLLMSLTIPRAIVSNLPYYITAPLLQRVAEARTDLDLAVLMMQKEVADRVTAPANDRRRGSLSVYLQFCFNITRISSVPAGAFLPPPKVESAVLKLVPRELPVPSERADGLFQLVREAFAQPRKTLLNNLLHRDKARVGNALLGSGLPNSVRPHQLEEKHWIHLAEQLN